MGDDQSFEYGVLRHLSAAYNLARWLTRNDHDAEDVVQEACLRAFRFFDRFRGADSRSWLLAIVRNTCFTWLKRNHPAEIVGTESIETVQPDSSELSVSDPAVDPESLAIRKATARDIDAAIDALAPEFREIIVLREIEELSYKEIANVVGVPVGTVMSRLARARADLRRLLYESHGLHSRKERLHGRQE